MRKFTKILFGALAFFAFHTNVNGQALNLNNGIFYVSGPYTTNRLESHLYIENTSNNPMNVMARCDKSEMTFGQQTYYCWFQCYDTTVTFQPEPLTIAGRSIDSLSFHSYLYPLSTVGTSPIHYTFYDQADPNDSIYATITYDVLNTGIDEIQNATLATASPNPANNLTGISYALPALNNARLVISNLLGEQVKSFELTTKQSLLFVSTSDLPSGMYVYPLINNGKPVATKKLIVAHR